MELIRKPAGPPRRVRRLLSYQVGNMQQQGARDYQEDSFCFVNATDVTEIKANGLLALMADGMGGLQDGKAVSETALQAMRAEFAAMDRRGDLAAQLMEAVHRTNALLYSQFGGNGGTTLVACLLFAENLYFASVGDSYLYLLRGGGLSRLNAEQNQCHQQYAALLRQGILDPRSANEADGAARLSEFLGSDRIGDLDATRRPLALQAGDQLLLCSDGVGGVLTPQELYRCMKDAAPMEACARMDAWIRSRALAQQDNYTALIIRCEY